jgi:hypothetical protein
LNTVGISDDLQKIASGTVCGHLLECGAQVSGGNFADPGKKYVDDLARLGNSFADVSPEGNFSISKIQGTGGRVSACYGKRTVTVRDARS